MKKRKKRKSILSRLPLLTVLVYFAVGFFSQEVMLYKYHSDIEEINRQIAEQEEKLQRIQALQPIYKTEEHYEKIAREKLGLVYADEKVFIDVASKP